jgi:hypothetical protein
MIPSCSMGSQITTYYGNLEVLIVHPAGYFYNTSFDKLMFSFPKLDDICAKKKQIIVSIDWQRIFPGSLTPPKKLSMLLSVKGILREKMKNWIRAKLNHKLWFWYIECTGCGKVLTWQEAGLISIEGAEPAFYCKNCLKSLGEKEKITIHIPRG